MILLKSNSNEEQPIAGRKSTLWVKLTHCVRTVAEFELVNAASDNEKMAGIFDIIVENFAIIQIKMKKKVSSS